MHNSGKINNTTIWWPKKTNETNSFKVKTWEGFDLAILKVKQIHYRELKFLQSDLTLNLLLPLVVTYWYDHVQALNPRTPSLLDLQNTNSHICDFEISLKGLATQTLPDLMIWEWFLVVILKEEDTIPFRSHKSTFKVSTKRVLGFPLYTMWNIFETLIT